MVLWWFRFRDQALQDLGFRLWRLEGSGLTGLMHCRVYRVSGACSRSPKVGNPIASILKSNV